MPSLDLLATLLLMQPRTQLAFWAASPHCCLMSSLTHQHLHVLLGRAALDLFIPQPVLIPGVAPAQVQHLAPGLVKPHEIPMDPHPELVQIPLDGIPSFTGVNHITQLGVTCKIPEVALDLCVSVVIK
ncbi:hypothetical protein WISP_46437 [Willisornis vidua]|uniref:Secreted protein n=1 Tax=Willisornis vidua TaxID=1566151 RepID=A0ABQ9DLE7_9PASS|nr:hypothetical protein WISP_46437 [Willisornis vidua]